MNGGSMDGMAVTPVRLERRCGTLRARSEESTVWRESVCEPARPHQLVEFEPAVRMRAPHLRPRVLDVGTGPPMQRREDCGKMVTSSSLHNHAACNILDTNENG